MLLEDFSENRRNEHTNEVSEAHWSYTQCTLFPTIAWYKCTSCECIAEEAITVLSDDNKHDAYAVKEFENAIFQHLRARGLSFNKITFISDGCASQFKSAMPFLHLSDLSMEGIRVDRQYSGANHGKSRSDGEGAVLKTMASNAVKGGRTVIDNAEQLYNYLKEEISLTSYSQAPHKNDNHKSRTVLLVQKIPRPTDTKKLRALPGTRKFHHVIATDKEGEIKARELSCACSSCLKEEYESCRNKDYVHHFFLHNLLGAEKGKSKAICARDDDDITISNNRKKRKCDASGEDKKSKQRKVVLPQDNSEGDSVSFLTY